MCENPYDSDRFIVEQTSPAQYPRLAGSAKQNNPTDQQCEYCGRWFTIEGLSGHQQSCQTAENPYFRFNEDEGCLEMKKCSFCGGSLAWDTPVEEQGWVHQYNYSDDRPLDERIEQRYPCPYHPEVDH